MKKIMLALVCLFGLVWTAVGLEYYLPSKILGYDCARIAAGRTPFPAQAVYPIPPALRNKPEKYLKVVGAAVVEKSAAEKTAIDTILATPVKYRKWDGTKYVPMTPAERAVVDEGDYEQTADSENASYDNLANRDLLNAMFLAFVDEFNRNRRWHGKPTVSRETAWNELRKYMPWKDKYYRQTILVYDGATNAAPDISYGGGNDGALVNVTWVPYDEYISSHFEFNGTSSGIDAGSSTNIENVLPMTLMLWANASTNTANLSCLAAKRWNNGDPASGWELSIGAKTNFVFTVDRATADAVVSTTAGSLTLGSWQHVAVVVVPTNIAILIDGAEVGYDTHSLGAGAKMSDAGRRLTFGIRNKTGAKNPYFGSLDEIRLYGGATPLSYARDVYLNQKRDFRETE